MERRDFDAQFDALLSSSSIPWENLPESSNLEECLHDFEIIDVYGAKTSGADGKAQKARIMLLLRILAPENAVGALHEEGFTIGTDADPTASNILTWESKNNFGGIAITKLRKFVGAANPKELIGKKFAAYTRNSPVGDRLFTNLISTAFYSVGTIKAGTPTAATPQHGRMRAGAVTPGNNQPSTTNGNMNCPMCHTDIPVNLIASHVSTCDGNPPQAQEEVSK